MPLTVKVLRNDQVSGFEAYTYGCKLADGGLLVFFECGGLNMPYQRIGPKEKLAIYNSEGYLIETDESLHEAIKNRELGGFDNVAEDEGGLPRIGPGGSKEEEVKPGATN